MPLMISYFDPKKWYHDGQASYADGSLPVCPYKHDGTAECSDIRKAWYDGWYDAYHAEKYSWWNAESILLNRFSEWHAETDASVREEHKYMPDLKPKRKRRPKGDNED